MFGIQIVIVYQGLNHCLILNGWQVEYWTTKRILMFGIPIFTVYVEGWMHTLMSYRYILLNRLGEITLHFDHRLMS